MTNHTNERNSHVAAPFRSILNSLTPLVGAPVRRMPPGECAYCDAHRNDSMMPSHTASERCESGKRPHCTCDTCF